MIYETHFRRRAITLAYRHLFRRGLKAVNYAEPHRYVLRDILRSSFRSGHTDEFDARRVMNTISFLRRAAWSHGFEHKIVMNLLSVRDHRSRLNDDAGIGL